MSALVRILDAPPMANRSALNLLLWWESRRLFFNTVVGGTGLLTLVGIHCFFALPPRATGVGSIIPLKPVLVYGALANLCYSLGWVSETIAKWVWGDRAPDLGPLLCRQGLIFSVGLTLLPMGMAAIYWIERVRDGAGLLTAVAECGCQARRHTNLRDLQSESRSGAGDVPPFLEQLRSGALPAGARFRSAL